jgi:hypothetical protein
MLTTPDAISPTPPAVGRASTVIAVATGLGWLLVAALIGSIYVGHSPGPYGVCQAPSGRSVPCSLLRR